MVRSCVRVGAGLLLAGLLSCQASEDGAAAGAGGSAGASGAAGGGLPAPAPEGCVDDAGAGHHVYSCDGFAFDVEVPPACLERACGLILDVHGFSMSGPMEDANTEMQRRGRERGYVVVQPSANPKPPVSSWDKAGGDDGAVLAMIERARRVWHLDARRVHATGFSQGGNMTWRLLCAHADLFASVAPAAFDGGCSFTGDQAPSREVPVLFMHGELDGLVPFAGALAQRDRVVARWQTDGGQVIAGDDTFTHTRYLTPSGTPFEFVTHRYAVPTKCLVADIKGHCFPGSSDPGTVPGQACSFACPAPTSFSWGDEVMAFFEAHPGP